MVERKGRVRAFKVPNVTAKTLLPKLINSIDQDATVYTDSATLYTHINEFFLKHASVNHTLHEYVRGNGGRADFRGNTRSGVVRCMHYLMRLSLVQVRSFDSR